MTGLEYSDAGGVPLNVSAMKRIAFLFLSLTLAGGAQAQLFSDNQLGGAVLGGVLGGVIGHNNDRKTAEGIGIGAGVGYLLGTLSDYDNGPRYSRGSSRISVGYSSGYGYRRFGHRHGYWHRPYYGHRHLGPRWGFSYSTYTPAVVYSTPAYTTPAYTVPTTTTYVTRSRPNFAVTGAAAGGLLGAVIGHNSDRQTAEGAAIGAGAGLLLGGIAEHNARQREAEQAAAAAARARVASSRSASLYSPGVVSGRTPVAQEAAAETPARQPVAPAGYNSMSAANRLFGR